MNLRFCAYLNIRKHKIELSKQYLAVFDDTTNSSLIQTSLENSDIDSGWRSTSCQNLLDLALKRLFESFPFYFLIN
ncbi:unnamed protein product [Rotaria sordida]|uniref:Uncharacterized protein n=1 Tax=Rotaria sordida TaxID=392033 RepID=A0A815DSM6_9BILA|nr:unnamed protein product [Rotaria sordida]CAF3828734.1 unnamed protein product [Rotaria sordida]